MKRENKREDLSVDFDRRPCWHLRRFRRSIARNRRSGWRGGDGEALSYFLTEFSAAAALMVHVARRCGMLTRARYGDATREAFTRQGSLVRTQPRPPILSVTCGESEESAASQRDLWPPPGGQAASPPLRSLGAGSSVPLARSSTSTPAPDALRRQVVRMAFGHADRRVPGQVPDLRQRRPVGDQLRGAAVPQIMYREVFNARAAVEHSLRLSGAGERRME